MRKGFSIIELTITLLFLSIAFSAIFTALRAHHIVSQELYLRRAALDQAITILETESFHYTNYLNLAPDPRFEVDISTEYIIPEVCKSVTVNIYLAKDNGEGKAIVLNKHYYNTGGL